MQRRLRNRDLKRRLWTDLLQESSDVDAVQRDEQCGARDAFNATVVLKGAATRARAAIELGPRAP